jgi:hypothetical protein
VRAHFELIHGLFVDVRRTVHRETLDTRGQRDRAHHLCTRSAGRVDDSTDGLIQHTVIVCLEADAYSLLLHLLCFLFSVLDLRSNDRAIGGLHPKLPPETRSRRSTRGCVFTQFSRKK